MAKDNSFPKKCAECDKHFCDKKVKDCLGNEWTIKKGPVFLCPHGANTFHKCTFGLCGSCKEQRGSPQKRSRKRKSRN
jgi:hypothetical protein